MADRQSIQQFLLGTAVEVVVVLDVTAVDTITMTIKDPTGSKTVDALAMTKESDKVYKYTWQSATTNVEGEYVATVEATSGGIVTVRQDFFILVRQPFM